MIVGLYSLNMSAQVPVVNESKLNFSVDSSIVGEWLYEYKGKIYILIEDDGAYYVGTKDVPYTIENNGSTLIINQKTTYHRIDNPDTTIIGIWRDTTTGEEIQYRNDSRYIGLFDDEKYVYTGTFSTIENLYNGFELRCYVQTENNKIMFHLLYFPYTEGTYTVQGDTLQITVNDNTTYLYRVNTK